jgi:hypothetical protein
VIEQRAGRRVGSPELEDEQRDRDGEDAVAERFDPVAVGQTHRATATPSRAGGPAAGVLVWFHR